MRNLGQTAILTLAGKYLWFVVIILVENAISFTHSVVSQYVSTWFNATFNREGFHLSIAVCQFV